MMLKCKNEGGRIELYFETISSTNSHSSHRHRDTIVRLYVYVFYHIKAKVIVWLNAQL